MYIINFPEGGGEFLALNNAFEKVCYCPEYNEDIYLARGLLEQDHPQLYKGCLTGIYWAEGTCKTLLENVNIVLRQNPNPSFMVLLKLKQKKTRFFD